MTREKARIDEYLRCAELGLTEAETARKIGVSRQAVNLVARRHGISFRPGGGGGCRLVSDEDCLRLALEGYTAREAAAALGVSPRPIWKAARRLGITFRDSRKDRRPRKEAGE